MKPSSRQRHQRAEAKRARREARKAKGPRPQKTFCPKCGHKTPDLAAGPLIRCALCGGVKR